MSTQSMDNFHGLSGQFSWTQRTLTMNIVQSTRSNTPMEMSTESMDFLQTGLNNCTYSQTCRHFKVVPRVFCLFCLFTVQYMASLGF